MDPILKLLDEFKCLITYPDFGNGTPIFQRKLHLYDGLTFWYYYEGSDTPIPSES